MAPMIHKQKTKRLHNVNVQVVFETAKLGNVNKLKTLLENRGVNINLRDCSGRTALMWAVENDLPTAVETLIEAGADVNQRRSIKKHLTPVMVAAEKGYTKVLQLLTASGADVNDHRFDKETPLTIALQTGHQTGVDILIDAGADCNYLSPGGTPVMLAVRNNRNCFELLANSGADVNTRDRWKNTPLTVAVARSCLHYVNCLIRAGADCSYVSPDGIPVMIAVKNNDIACLQVLVDNGADVNTPDRWNNTPLTLAVTKNRLDCVHCLIPAGADCSYMSVTGSPVMIAIKNNDSRCLRVLIDNGADVNTSDRWGNTPLTCAIQKDYLASVKTLISGGADLNLRSPKGPPLYTAYSLGKLEVAELLLQWGANVDIANSTGHTLLMLAAIKHKEKWVQTLIQAGANANLVSSNGRTAFILAIRRRHTFCQSFAMADLPRQTGASRKAKNTECVNKLCDRCKLYRMQATRLERLISSKHLRESRCPLTVGKYCKCCRPLLEHSTNVNIQDKNGKTALMYCFETNNRHCAKLLLESKADPNIRDNYGKTALMYCVVKNKIQFAEILLENKADPNIQDKRAMGMMGCSFGTDEIHLAELLINTEGCPYIFLALRYCAVNNLKHFGELNGKICDKCRLDSEADPNIQDNDGKTALMYSVLNNNPHFAELLLDNSADPNVQDTEGKTALMYCAGLNRTRFAFTRHRLCGKCRLDNAADPNIQDNYGKTALMYSVLNNDLHFTKYLLDTSANANIQDTEGKTALMHSIYNNCFDMLLSKIPSKFINIHRSDKTHATALEYLLRALVNDSVYNSDIMHRLYRLLRLGANPILHPSDRYLLNKLCCQICCANYMYSHKLKVNLELMRIFVCNGMGSRAKETMPMAELYWRFIFDTHYRSFLRFAYYQRNCRYSALSDSYLLPNNYRPDIPSRETAGVSQY